MHHRQHTPATLSFRLAICFLCHRGSILLKPAARGYEVSKLLNEIAAEADVITDLYATSDPRLSTGFSSSTIVGYGL
jgi:hypothetical protein